MTSDLVQQCRTCSAIERQDIARELARTGDDEAIAELIKMVEGAVRVSRPVETRYRGVSYRPHWWSKEIVRQEPYQFDPSDHYDYQDQLIGIGAMGTTGSSECLEYLLALITPDEAVKDIGVINEVNFGGSAVVAGTAIVTFPNAKGELAQEMQYSKRVGGVDGGGGGGEGGGEFEGLGVKGHTEYCRAVLCSHDPHKTIMEAIENLAKACGQTSPFRDVSTIVD
jgi:hypothetical protein